MADSLRMNIKILEIEDSEVFEYLSNFSGRTRAAQARKLMLLGLVELNRLGSGVPAPEIKFPRGEPVPPAANDDSELIVQSGVNDLF